MTKNKIEFAVVLLNVISVHEEQKEDIPAAQIRRWWVVLQASSHHFSKKKKKSQSIFYIKQHEGFLKRDAPLVVSLSHG